VGKDPVEHLSDLPKFSEHGPALFILDASQRSDCGAELVRELKSHCTTGRIVVLADHFEPDAVISAWQAGADGFCLATAPPVVLICSLELAMLGDVVVPSALAREILHRASCVTEPESYDDRERINGVDSQCRKLSSRESEILCCLTEGASNKIIGRKLNLCEATVKVHIKSILRKIGATNRTQAAIWAANHRPMGAVR
jgi:two-component system nitrate/nitrite response regulator NarL